MTTDLLALYCSLVNVYILGATSLKGYYMVVLFNKFANHSNSTSINRTLLEISLSISHLGCPTKDIFVFVTTVLGKLTYYLI